MHKYTRVFLGVAVFFVMGIGVSAFAQSSAQNATQTAADVYTCPMHPEVTSDKPGSCPKCGMFLVKKDSEGAK